MRRLAAVTGIQAIHEETGKTFTEIAAERTADSTDMAAEREETEAGVHPSALASDQEGGHVDA